MARGRNARRSSGLRHRAQLSDAINVEVLHRRPRDPADPILLAPMLDIEAIKGKKLLVVDDVADTGRTLALVL